MFLYMTNDELEQLLQGQPLTETIDVRTVTIDLLKKADIEDLLPLFFQHLHSLKEEQLHGYFFMKRG
jgi:hypothetical protein